MTAFKADAALGAAVNHGKKPPNLRITAFLFPLLRRVLKYPTSRRAEQLPSSFRTGLLISLPEVDAALMKPCQAG
jgi:hypothetical protein